MSQIMEFTDLILNNLTTYGHARAAFSEVYYSGVELVLEEVGMSNHCTSQRQTGAGHKSGSHHLALQRENKSIRKRHELQTESMTRAKTFHDTQT